jgi:hypothetical protein
MCHIKISASLILLIENFLQELDPNRVFLRNRIQHASVITLFKKELACLCFSKTHQAANSFL